MEENNSKYSTYNQFENEIQFLFSNFNEYYLLVHVVANIIYV